MDEEPIDMSAECASCHYSHAACVCKHTPPPPTEGAEIVERHYQLDQCDSDEMIAYYWKQEADISRALVTTQEAELIRLRQRVAELEGAVEPFAAFAGHAVDDEGWASTTQRERIVDWFGPSEFRRIASALNHQPNGDEVS